ncbi:MAG: hypothetical protein A2589_00805 [Candidatus Vogelbacteria bacterium RIFOXYD1_FULL_46_19]|uniref:Uncharacterized protein n=1 Tax=Candidatus Vogelbacteria bacterium RIFOXYD1_FULL_46_19 TaxID=1802439 RepID=A0A1G2QFL3_9BACT|nr:MAG: hypothetical protein A2589_00805 [Candidatus Vogelbacteria bacterium RIFOXYD1_FULL_46_19]
MSSLINFGQQLARHLKGDSVSLYAAAIAYYTVFSLVPTLVIATVIASLTLGRERGSGALSELVETYFGQSGLTFFNKAAESLATAQLGGILTVVGILVLIYGAVNLFKHLQHAFSLIFNFTTETEEDLVQAVINRHSRSVIYLAILLLLILVLAIVNVTANVLVHWFVDWLWFNLPPITLSIVNYLIMTLVAIFILTFIYRLTSLKRLTWKNAWCGGTVGGILFALINSILGWYISISIVVPIYGAASFLVIFLLWSYYMALSILIGAEVGKILECRYPKHRQKVCL